MDTNATISVLSALFAGLSALAAFRSNNLTKKEIKYNIKPFAYLGPWEFRYLTIIFENKPANDPTIIIDGNEIKYERGSLIKLDLSRQEYLNVVDENRYANNKFLIAMLLFKDERGNLYQYMLCGLYDEQLVFNFSLEGIN